MAALGGVLRFHLTYTSGPLSITFTNRQTRLKTLPSPIVRGNQYQLLQYLKAEMEKI